MTPLSQTFRLDTCVGPAVVQVDYDPEFKTWRASTALQTDSNELKKEAAMTHLAMQLAEVSASLLAAIKKGIPE